MATTIRAEDTENLEEIEMQFAVKAVEHMSVYWRILGTVRGSELRLTRLDSEILEHLKKDFPDFDAAASIDEDEMKSKSGKGKWRAFMMAYEDKVDEFNFGTLLRINARDEPGEKTTIFGIVRPAKHGGGEPANMRTLEFQSRESSFWLLKLHGIDRGLMTGFMKRRIRQRRPADGSLKACMAKGAHRFNSITAVKEALSFLNTCFSTCRPIFRESNLELNSGPAFTLDCCRQYLELSSATLVTLADSHAHPAPDH
ncbi:MAG: hypothetical protein M1829_001189 [Trizodia sp. TS-e1964]|nr:MAG: hypothetical protein M1829_001189 [Trizodia sp. TS-e1964]